VTAGSWQSFDLLRRRRQELGLETVTPTSSKELLARGGLIAAGLVALAVVIWGGTFAYARWLLGREDSLRPAGAQHQAYTSQLATLRQQLDTRTKANQALADAIVALPASSVLLAELARLMPADAQLNTAKQEGQQLSLAGFVTATNGLRAINALQLQLEGSPLFSRGGVQVIKITEQAAAQSPGQGSAAGAIPGLTFEIKADFAPSARRSNLPLLQTNGATGLLRRLQVLQQEGLLQ
jgi:Tfp pilus assembly protein PilN